MARLYPGAVEVLSALQSRGMPMGVVTSKGTPMATRGIGLFDIARFFAVIVTADDVPVHKPDPYPIVHAAGLLGVDARACAYVGDSPHDMAAARDAGSVAIAATWGVSSEKVLVDAGCDYVLGDLRALPDLLFGPEA
jgi:HAD superfamily hydrolase (TIGR01509 family)